MTVTNNGKRGYRYKSFGCEIFLFLSLKIFNRHEAKVFEGWKVVEFSEEPALMNFNYVKVMCTLANCTKRSRID